MPRSNPHIKNSEKRQMRSAARLAAVQALYQMEIAKDSMTKVRSEFETHRFGMEIDGEQMREADVELFRQILDDVVARQAAIDQMTDRALVDRWPLGRIDSTLRALFRASCAELQDQNGAPPKVIITEYIDVAKAFWPESKEPGLVNAVLDIIAREQRPDAFEKA